MADIRLIPSEVQTEPYDIAIYNLKKLAHNKAHYKGQILSISIKDLDIKNTKLFTRMVVIYAPLQTMQALTPEQIKHGWNQFLGAHKFLLSGKNLNQSIMSPLDIRLEGSTPILFRDQMSAFLIQHPSSPLKPMIQYQLGIYNQYFLKSDLSMAWNFYQLSASNGFSEAQYKAAKFLYKGIGTDSDKRKAMEYLSHSVKAGNINANYFTGKLYESEKRMDFAFKFYKASADRDHIKALYKVGELYEIGSGTTENLPNAFIHYEKAYLLGHEHAMMKLANFYENGKGCTVDKKKALELYTKAAKYYSDATLKLAEFSQMGIEQEENPQKALGYLIDAAKQKNHIAEYKLGLELEKGTLIKKDIKRAYDYIELAAKGNYAPAQYRMGLFYESKKDQTSYTKELAFTYYKYAAEQNLPEAIYKLGYFHENGILGRKSLDAAMKCYAKAADKGDPNALFRLHVIFQRGLYKYKENPKKAMEYLKEAAERGHAQALYELGTIYEAKNDSEQYLRYYADAAKRNYPAALCKMGELEDLGVVQNLNPNGISNYFIKACELGDKLAAFKIAQCHELGIKTPVNRDLAISFYKKALEFGHLNARDKIEELEGFSLLNDYNPQIRIFPRTYTSVSTFLIPPPKESETVISQPKKPKTVPAPARPVRFVKPSTIMADDSLFLPLGSYPQPHQYPAHFADALYEEEHRELINQAPKRQKI